MSAGLPPASTEELSDLGIAWGPLGLAAPSWATEQEETDGGIIWYHEITTKILPASIGPDAEPDELTVSMSATDCLQVHGLQLVLVREPAVEIYLGDRRMSPAHARNLASALVTMADIIEGGV